jgi:gluconate 5-dehydrogenase
MNKKVVQELYDLKGKTAVITGGGSGLGFQSAMALAESGANVVVVSRRLRLCQQAAGRIKMRCHVQTLALRCDVSQEEQVETMVKKVLEKFKKIDILVNNSAFNRDTLIDRAEKKDWDDLIATNLTGVFLCSRAVSPMMIKQKKGKIINIGSIYGVVGGVPHLYEGLDVFKAGCSAAYGASKGGVINLTRTMACYLAQWGINVNCVSPGCFLVSPETSAVIGPAPFRALTFRKRYEKRCPLGRMGRPEEIKGIIVFLSSDASQYMTGQNLMLDGGWTAW